MSDSNNFIKDSLTQYIKDNGETCWFCKSKIEVRNIPVKNWCVVFPMHYKVSNRIISPTMRQKTWKELNIYIPACKNCKGRFRGYKFVTGLILVILLCVPLLIIASRQDYLFCLWLPIMFTFTIVLQLIYRIYTYLIQLGFKNKIGDYNQVKILKSQGWDYSQVTG